MADLAAMRELAGDPRRVNPLIPIDFIIDPSLMVDVAGHPDALKINPATEIDRNGQRYSFLRWAQQAFANFNFVPPGNGILHQVNLEVLAEVVWIEGNGRKIAYPDVLVGRGATHGLRNDEADGLGRISLRVAYQRYDHEQQKSDHSMATHCSSVNCTCLRSRRDVRRRDFCR